MSFPGNILFIKNMQYTKIQIVSCLIVEVMTENTIFEEALVWQL